MGLVKHFHEITGHPLPIYFIRCDYEKNKFRPAFDHFDLLLNLDKNLLSCAFRGTKFQNLLHILNHGVDVDPNNPIIYADVFEKAWEYGGWPKIILGYDYDCLEKTYKEVSTDISEDRYLELKKKYPTEMKSVDGNKIWFTKLDADDTRVATQYEISYAKWIKCAPAEALQVIFIFASETHYLNEIENIVEIH